MMSQAPFCDDGSAPADNACHTIYGKGDESEQQGGVDGKVVHPLFGLFNQRVPIDFPG